MTIHLKWTEDFSVGDKEIDSQHKKLLMEINKILDAIVFGVDAKEVHDNIIPFLDEYIKEHFSYEENYMRKMNYPNFKKHKRQHYNFIKNYIKFKNEFDNGVDRKKFISRIEKFLGTWWLKHIGKEDREYQQFLINERSKNIDRQLKLPNIDW